MLEVSQLWTQVVDEVAADYPDVTLEHQLVDSMRDAAPARAREAST